jgi:AAA-like domain/TIR domain
MGDFHFQVAKHLPANSPSYILRKADQDVAFHLDRVDYISIIEPRQQGKTSLISQLMYKFRSSGYTFVVCDMSTVKSSDMSAKEWYFSLGTVLLSQLSHIVSLDQKLLPPENSASWEKFLFSIAQRAESVGQRVVIVLDEIGKIPPSLATDFFSVIRSVYIYRLSFSYLEYLTFIIAGAFNPKELISDTSVSDFNVDQRIHLEDFDRSQVKQLAAHLELSLDLTEAVTEQIYYWTSGQPYLSQLLCSSLAKQKERIHTSTINDLVQDAVEKFLNHDLYYLERFKRLIAMPELLAYTQSIANGIRPRFSAGLNDMHFRLAHVLGVIKAGPDGLCEIRNRICLRVLEEISGFSDPKQPGSTQPLSLPATPKRPGSTQPLDEPIYDVFISYSHKDKDAVYSVLLQRLESEGIRFYIDEQNFDLGAPTLRNIARGINQSRKILLVLTPSSLESEWVMFESLLTHSQDPTNRELRLIPIILKPCTLPPELQSFTYLDLTKPEDLESRMQRLISSIKP